MNPEMITTQNLGNKDGFSIQTQLNLAKYYIENERNKLQWSQIILKIGKGTKDAAGKRVFKISALNAISGSSISLVVPAHVIEGQKVKEMRQLLTKAGCAVAANDVSIYFLVKERLI